MPRPDGQTITSVRDKLLLAVVPTERPQVIELCKEIVRRREHTRYLRHMRYFLLRHDRTLAIDSMLESLGGCLFAFEVLRRLDRDDVLARLEVVYPHLYGEARRKADALRLLLSDDPAATLFRNSTISSRSV